ncbi:MAG TPA: SH3 domain-containing protein, partial [Phaeodactylibacter sp.]|nr:SH3 domain-containing protein [Phaeodactylibacter sp.]
QKKQWAKAILNYERAKLLAPNDNAIANNLQLANSKTIDEIEKIPTFFLARWWSQIRNLTHSGIWSIFAIVLLWVGVGGLVVWILGKERAQRKRGFAIGLVALALSLLTFSLAYSSYQNQKNSQIAIVMAKEIPLKLLPDDLSKEVRLLHEGTKLNILEKITSWYKVRLENGEEGWVMDKDVEKV